MAAIPQRSGESWESCMEAGCGAAGLVQAGRLCVAHVDDEGLRRVVGGARHGRPLDARGATIDQALLERILDVAPTDSSGRPVLREARFDRATFGDEARLERVVFERDASFDGATFESDASFVGTTFESYARFGRVRFGGTASFSETKFAGHAWFAAARFAQDANFEGATFSGPAWFGGTTFEADALFPRSRFGSDVSFDETSFGCHALFAETVFGGEARLTEASFEHEPRYDGAVFRGKSGAPQAAVRQAVWTGSALAPWPARAGATILDHAVPAATLAVAAVLGLMLDRLQYSPPYAILLGAAACVSVGFIARNLVSQGETGQTSGKRRLGLSLVRQRDALPVGTKMSVIRYALHLVDTLPLLMGWLWPLWDRRRQTFADKITTTVVIRRRGWDGSGSSDLAEGSASASAFS